jgi:hypothetical protein
MQLKIARHENSIMIRCYYITLYYRNGCLRYLRAINFHCLAPLLILQAFYDIKSRYMEDSLVDPAQQASLFEVSSLRASGGAFE